MRVGTVLKILSLIILIAGGIVGALMGVGLQAYMNFLIQNTNGQTAPTGFQWVVAGIAWFIAIFTSSVVYAMGTISNNIHDINIKMEDVQFWAKESPKSLRRIVYYLGGPESNVQSGRERQDVKSKQPQRPDNYMRPKDQAT